MTVEVGFLQPTERPEQGLVSVPVTALLAAEANTFQCFVYNPETQAVDLRDVRLVELVNSSALVAGGLRPGEIVASKGVAFLQDGQQVALLGKGLARYNP
jgi:hypothetical protein